MARPQLEQDRPNLKHLQVDIRLNIECSTLQFTVIVMRSSDPNVLRLEIDIEASNVGPDLGRARLDHGILGLIEEPLALTKDHARGDRTDHGAEDGDWDDDLPDRSTHRSPGRLDGVAKDELGEVVIIELSGASVGDSDSQSNGP